MKKDNSSIIWGIILLIIGLIFLLSNVYGFNAWQIIGTYWPLILVVIGAYILLTGMKRNNKK